MSGAKGLSGKLTALLCAFLTLLAIATLSTAPHEQSFAAEPSNGAALSVIAHGPIQQGKAHTRQSGEVRTGPVVVPDAPDGSGASSDDRSNGGSWRPVECIMLVITLLLSVHGIKYLGLLIIDIPSCIRGNGGEAQDFWHSLKWIVSPPPERKRETGAAIVFFGLFALLMISPIAGFVPSLMTAQPDDYGLLIAVIVLPLFGSASIAMGAARWILPYEACFVDSTSDVGLQR